MGRMIERARKRGDEMEGEAGGREGLGGGREGRK
jgi:hypothetical protein